MMRLMVITFMLSVQAAIIGPSDSTPSGLATDTQHLTDYRINCFNRATRLGHTSIDGCRPSYNAFRAYPDYGRVQLFSNSPPKRPVQPHAPPYKANATDADCTVVVMGALKGFNAHFSFRQVRDTAIRILEECEGDGSDPDRGLGGFTFIGEQIGTSGGSGWLVLVQGKSLTGQLGVLGEFGRADAAKILLEAGTGGYQVAKEGTVEIS